MDYSPTHFKTSPSHSQHLFYVLENLGAEVGVKGYCHWDERPRNVNVTWACVQRYDRRIVTK